MVSSILENHLEVCVTKTKTKLAVRYVTSINTQAEAYQVKLLIESLRRFGGDAGQFPVWLFFTDLQYVDNFSGLGEVTQFPLEIEPAYRSYPLSEKVFACAMAEEMAGSDVGSLVWLNPDCLIFNPPDLFVLGDQFDAAVRPVHIRNVGSLANTSLDEYWRRVYEVVGVDQIPYTIESFVDRQVIRPYFNTHCFAINPARGILQAWRAFFNTVLQDKTFQETSCRDELHQLFLHQVVLSALLMKSVEKERLLMLPPEYSYPIHLQEKLPATNRVDSLNQLVCMVYEDINLLDEINILEPIRSWLIDNRRN